MWRKLLVGTLALGLLGLTLVSPRIGESFSTIEMTPFILLISTSGATNTAALECEEGLTPHDVRYVNVDAVMATATAVFGGAAGEFRGYRVIGSSGQAPDLGTTVVNCAATGILPSTAP